MKEKVMPYSLECEQALLGMLIENNNLISETALKIDVDDFYKEIHRSIFKEILTLKNRGIIADITSLMVELKDNIEYQGNGGIVYLMQLQQAFITTANIGYSMKIITELSKRRKLILTATKMMESGYMDKETDVDQIFRESINTLHRISDGASSDLYVTSKTGLYDYVDVLEKKCSEDGSEILQTGYYDLDFFLTGGLQKKTFYLLAARPSMGKSAFAVNMLINMAKKSIASGIISLESSINKMFNRMFAIEAGVNSASFTQRKITDNEWGKVISTARKFYDEFAPICIADKGDITVEKIECLLEDMIKRHGIQVLVVDYIGLIAPSKERSRNEEVSVMSRKFANMTKKFNVPILVLSQLNREVSSRTDKRPHLHDLRDSGSLEQDADVVMMMYRDNYYNSETTSGNITEIIVRKNKDGLVGTTELLFQPEYTKFVNLEEGYGTKHV